MSLGVSSSWKGMSSCTRKATPPPLFVPRSFLTRLKFLMAGSLDLSVNLVS